MHVKINTRNRVLQRSFYFVFFFYWAESGVGILANVTRTQATFRRAETATRGVYRPPKREAMLGTASADNNKTRIQIQTSRYVARAQRIVAATSRVYSVTSERRPTRTGIGCQVTQ